MTRQAGICAVGLLGAALVGLSAAPALADGDPTAIEQGDTRSTTDTAVGVVAGLGALTAGTGLVVVARRKRT